MPEQPARQLRRAGAVLHRLVRFEECLLGEVFDQIGLPGPTQQESTDGAIITEREPMERVAVTGQAGRDEIGVGTRVGG